MRFFIIGIVALSIQLGTALAADSTVEDSAKAVHVLNRLAYGPAPGDVARVRKMGVARYIEQQLDPAQLPMPADLTSRLNALETTRLSAAQVFATVGPPARKDAKAADADTSLAVRKLGVRVFQQAAAYRLLRATRSPAQLQEVMTDFWFNHFNVWAGKGVDRFWVGAYEREAIRPFALGRFRDLLGATAKHPAMLHYLDNWQSVGNQTLGAGRKKGLNENYAREVMELHTLGVDGGYTQHDVTELARILTGWTYLPDELVRNPASSFSFAAERHDPGEKVFLGVEFENAGVAEGERALDMLAENPATARHLAYELVQYFVADDPPKPLVEKVAQKFLATRGDIRQVLATIFASEEFFDPRYERSMFKTPYQYVVSTLRATDFRGDNFDLVLNQLNKLGMPLFGCATPDGYKTTRDIWLNPDGMSARLSFAYRAGTGRLTSDPAPAVATAKMTSDENLQMQAPDIPAENPPSAAAPEARVAAFDADELMRTLGGGFSAKTLAAIDAQPSNLRAGLVLGSPEFMQR